MIPIRSWLWAISLGIIIAVLMSGCLGVKTPPVARTVPPSLFIDYQRTGGFAGVNDRVVIFDNGVTLISNRDANYELVLNSTELERVGRVFADADFDRFSGNYTSSRGGADLFQYTLSWHGRTVHTEDTAIPSGMEPVIEEMNRILALGPTGSITTSTLPKIGS